MTPVWQRARWLGKPGPVWVRIGRPVAMTVKGTCGRDGTTWRRFPGGPRDVVRYVTHLVGPRGSVIVADPAKIELLGGPDDFADDVAPERIADYVARHALDAGHNP